MRAKPSESERIAVVGLAGLSGVGSASLEVLREHFGSAVAICESRGDIPPLEGVRADAVKAIAEAGDILERGEALLKRAREMGVTVLVHTDDAYPKKLSAAPSHPPALYVLGELPDTKCVAVVGSREADEYGLGRTRAVVDRLCAAGVTVVSGGARGVDSEAHVRALEVGGRTVAVLGLGLDHSDARQQWRFLERMARKGAVVSEFALPSGGNNNHFPQRNRTIAGLSDAVVLTRGKEKSGALGTTSAAERLKRPVFAIPGDVGTPLSFAGNSLLAARKAFVTLDGAEVLKALGEDVPDEAATAPRNPDRPLAPTTQKVLDALGPAPVHLDDLAVNSGLSMPETLSALLELELAGLCTTRPGKYFLRR